MTFNNGTKAIELVTYGVTFGGSGAIIVSGPLASTASSATATLDKDGSGKLTLGVANTYYGVTTISAGVINIQNNAALGSSATNTLVVNGAALEVQGGLNGVAEPITLNGSGITTTGGLRSISGDNVFTGLITLGSSTRINSDLNILSFTNATKALELSTYALNIGGASGDVVLSGLMNGSGDITKDGGAATTLTLSGNNNSGSGIYTGNINVGTVGVPAAGILKVITSNNALGTTAGKTTIYSGSALNIGDGLTAITVPENFDIYGTGISSGGAIRNISGTNTLTGDISLLAASRINSDVGNIIINNVTEAISMGSFALNIGGTLSGAVTVSGVITGSGGTLTKDGLATNFLYLSGNNTYTGVTAISIGVINVTSANALGDVSGNTTIAAAAAALQIQGGITLAAEPISVSSTGIATDGGIRNISGNNIITGTVTSAGASRINTDLGTLTLNNAAGSLVLNASTTIGGVNNTLITGKISGTSASNSMTKDGTGTLTLSGTTNDYLGQTLVTNGIVIVNNANSLGSTSSASNNTVVSGTGTVQLDGTGITIAEPFTISGSGYTSLGVIRNPSGANTLSGAISLNNAASATVISTSTGADLFELSGAISTGTSTSYILTFDGTGNIKSSGPISGAGGITKLGVSTLTITGNNTSYTGATIIGGAILNGGIVNIQNNNALGAVAAGQGTMVYNGSTLQFQGGLTAIAAEPVNIRGNGYNSILGVINNLSGLNVFTGPITLDSASRIVSSGTDTDSLRITGTIALQDKQLTVQADEGVNITNTISSTGSPVNSLIKTGSAYLTLGGTSNSYIGATTVTAGVLNLGAAGVVPDNSLLYLNGGSLGTNYAETIKKLYLTANSAINLGSSSHTITFTSVDALLDNKELIINGWQGSYTDTSDANTKLGGTGGKILFLNDTLLGYQLDQIKFIDPSNSQNYYAIQYKSNKYLVPLRTAYAGADGLDNSTATKYSNVSLSTSNTVGVSISGEATPSVIYTPIQDNANIKISEIVTFLNAGKSVKVVSDNASGRQTGTIVVNASLSSTLNTGSTANTLALNGRGNIVVYQNITLTNNASTNPVPNIDFKSDSSDVVIQAGLILNAKQQSTTTTGINGGTVSLTAFGKVRVYANGYIESKGANNTSSGAGGDGGRINLTGTDGISIFGNINTTNGWRNNNSSDLTLSKPGTLVISNETSGAFDGQYQGTVAVGNIIKQGAGLFSLTRSFWPGHKTSADILYKAYDTVSAGTLFLNSGDALSDSATVIVNDGATLDLNGKAETIGMIAGAGIIKGTGGSLTLSGVATSSSSPIIANFSGVLSGTFGLTKSVSGQTSGIDTLVLSSDNSNTYNGVITVNYGVLKVSNEKALGSVTANTVINGGASNGGTVLIDSAGYTITEPFNITGTGFVANYGAIRNLGKQTTLSGAITLGGSATIASFGSNTVTSSDSLVVTGGINTINSTYALTLNTVRGMRIGDQGVAGSKITGAGAIIKNTGTDTLVMNSSNDYSGTTTVSTGVIVLKTATGLGTGVSGTTDNTSITSGAAVRLDISGANIPEYFSINGTGAVTGTGAIRVPATSASNTLSGTITIASANSRINSDAPLLTLNNATSIATGSNMSVAIGGLGEISITGALTGSGTITKDGTGAGSILTLKGNSTGFSGAITVNSNSNILKVSPTVNTNTSVLGTTTGMITINSGSAMTIEGGVSLVSKPITIFGTGIANDGAIRNISGANTITGAITVSSAARINNDDASNALTISTGAYTNSFTSTIGGIGSVNISSVISGAGALVKDGGTATTLTLSGASTAYTGNISVGTVGTPAAGILRVITSGSALGTNAGTTTIYDGSALHIGDGTAITLADNITVYGTGIGGAGVIRNILGANILSGLTTLASVSRINSDAGTLTFNNGTKAIELLSYALNIGGASGDVVLSGPVNGSGDIT